MTTDAARAEAAKLLKEAFLAGDFVNINDCLQDRIAAALVAAHTEADAAGYERGLREAAKEATEVQKDFLAMFEKFTEYGPKGQAQRGAQACLEVTTRIEALLPAPTKEPTKKFCNKCGYTGTEGMHRDYNGCCYEAMPCDI